MINKQDAPYENQEDDSFKLEEFGYIPLKAMMAKAEVRLSTDSHKTFRI